MFKKHKKPFYEAMIESREKNNIPHIAIKLRVAFPIFRKPLYAFMDTKEYLGDQCFINHKVRVKFGPEYIHPDTKWHVLFCKVRKKDEERFKDALRELERKIMITMQETPPDLIGWMSLMERKNMY